MITEELTEDILNRLDKLTFTGRITNSTIGLIVPFSLAYEEMSYYYKDLTLGELKSILKKNNVVILNTPDDLEKYRAARQTKGNH
jgi:hypothetical protein